MNIKKLKVENINEIIELMWNVQMGTKQIPVVFCDEESKQFYKELVHKRMNEKLMFFGMFDEENMIGIIGLEGNRISDLYVLKEYQRKGVGTNLLRFGLEVLKEYDTVFIDSVDEAKKFYKKNGFKNVSNDYNPEMQYERKRFKSIFKI